MEDTKVVNLRSKSLPSVRPGLYLWAEGDLRFCTASGKDTKSRKRTLGSGSKLFHDDTKFCHTQQNPSQGPHDERM